MPGRQEAARRGATGGRPRADPGAPRAYPRSSSVAATSTARSSEPATSRRAIAARPDRRRRRAAQGRGLAQPRVVGGGKRHEAGDQRRGQRRAARHRAQEAQDAVGSTQAEWTAKAIRTTRIRSASTPPSASASALTSVWPRSGSQSP